MQKLRPKFEEIDYNKEVAPESLIQRNEQYLKLRKRKAYEFDPI